MHFEKTHAPAPRPNGKPARSAAPNRIFSVDVEEWFHVNGVREIPTAEWIGLESRVERNLRTLLDEFDEAGVQVTCFILGWIAEQYPALIREVSERGHEVASHGYEHRLIHTQTRAEFAQDIRKAKTLIEQAAGCEVTGYRAPSFSITEATSWAFDELAASGHRYDSSVFPAARENGGIIGSAKEPHLVNTANGPITEFPISVARLGWNDFCFFGGGYLRLFPYPLIEQMARRVIGEGRPVIYYIHPREIDPDHPRMEMGPLKRFKRYVNLSTTRPKVRAVLREGPITTFRRWLDANPALAAGPDAPS
jgi:polysaccharide deacetylase family protein (PEP-CTERM system associated)